MTELKGFKELSIDAVWLFKQYQIDMMISDMTFTQLYAWMTWNPVYYKEINGYLCLVSKNKQGKVAAYSPLGTYKKKSFNAVVKELEQKFRRWNLPLQFDFVPENWLDRFYELEDVQMVSTYHDRYSDYVYQADEFLCLSGRKNENKRYQIRYITNRHSCQYLTMTKDNIHMVHSIIDQWCERASCENCYWGCEREAILRITAHWDKFNCKGAYVLIDGITKAFMIGEQISSNMVVSHFQKADRSIKGLYAYISHEFYKREYPEITYINLQEDMGIEGIKESKLGYNPCHMIKKYSIIVKEERSNEVENQNQVASK